MHKTLLSPRVIYQLVAEAGLRRHFHLGDLQATRQLAAGCHVDKSWMVLDTSCASGKTACYLARHHGCRVIGVDIVERMIQLANECIRADAMALPFRDNQFDVVLGEFVTGLLEDRQQAMREYLRVVKPNGFVGLNEAAWVDPAAPAQLREYLASTFAVKPVLSADVWQKLLLDAGLRDLLHKTYTVTASSRRSNDLQDVLRSLPGVLRVYLTNPVFRRFIREALSVPKDFLKYFGYVIYVGRN